MLIKKIVKFNVTTENWGSTKIIFISYSYCLKKLFLLSVNISS